MSTRAESIGARLRSARDDLGWSQSRLASELGITQPAIADWERGEKEPSARNLARLATALSVSTDWLLSLTPERSDT